MEKILEEAIKKHREGRLKEAIDLYKNLLELNPNNVQVLVLTGKIYLKVKKPKVAAPFFEHANKIMPENPDILTNMGKSHMQLGSYAKAKEIYNQVLEKNRDHIPTILNLAKLNKLESNFDQAILLYKGVIEKQPDSIIALNNLANVYQEKGMIDESLILYTKALEVNPQSTKLRMNYANILQIDGKFDEALEEYRKALSINPKFTAVYKNLADLYPKIYSYEKALKEIETLFKSGVNIPEILLSAGILAINNSDFKLSKKILAKNHELFPDHYESLYQLGISYHQSGYFKKALIAYEKAYAIKENSDILLYAMAKAYTDTKQDKKALEFLHKAVEINPNNYTVQHELIRNRLNTCDWSKRKEDELNLKEISRKQIELETSDPIPFLNLNYFHQENEFLKECSEHSAQNSIRKVAKIKSELIFKHEPRIKDKIRVGYISPDFRDHPTGRVTVDFISAHSKEDYEVFCFSLIADLPNDTIQNKFKESCDHYISLYNVPTVAAAKIIYENQIDILIDIAGYTTYSRTDILALQPAPIQCQMIGFPGTMGSSFIQYIIADDFLIPETHEEFYTEKIVRLPYGFPGSILDVNLEKKTRKDFNLPEEKFIYCCFNSQYKYSPELFDAWMNILREVPDSILLLKGGSDSYKNNILNEVGNREVDQSRIFFADNLPFPDYMARNNVCDLFLDTFFYTAGSTAINALQMGLPVLTFAGDTNASRMGASIVQATPLQDFILESVDGYIGKAIFYGNNRIVLDKIKNEYKSKVLKTDLFNKEKFVSRIEDSFTKIWENFLMGKSPENIYIE